MWAKRVLFDVVNSDGRVYRLVVIEVDCKTARIFALVAHEIASTLRAKDLERGRKVE